MVSQLGLQEKENICMWMDLIDFDLSNPKGSSVCTLLNGENAQYTELLKEGDVLEIFWKD